MSESHGGDMDNALTELRHNLSALALEVKDCTADIKGCSTELRSLKTCITDFQTNFHDRYRPLLEDQINMREWWLKIRNDLITMTIKGIFFSAGATIIGLLLWALKDRLIAWVH